jgi:hypothetical protein
VLEKQKWLNNNAWPSGEQAALLSVQGLVFGNFGEVSEATHKLLDAVATSRVRVAGPQTGRRGAMRI